MAGSRKRSRKTAKTKVEALEQASLLEVPGSAFWERFPSPFAGLDEAGRGCLAGPVAAAAVILPDGLTLDGLTDSKAMTSESREELEPQIKARAVSWAIGLSWPREIDRINILQASLLAMCRAVRNLKTSPVFLAIDGNHPLPLKIQQQSIVGGDGLVPAIAAASVLAKTSRDRLIGVLDKHYPGYGLSQHKGYATKEHYAALKRLGPSRLHRHSFRGVASGADAVNVRKGDQLWLPST